MGCFTCAEGGYECLAVSFVERGLLEVPVLAIYILMAVGWTYLRVV